MKGQKDEVVEGQTDRGKDRSREARIRSHTQSNSVPQFTKQESGNVVRPKQIQFQGVTFPRTEGCPKFLDPESSFAGIPAT